MSVPTWEDPRPDVRTEDLSSSECLHLATQWIGDTGHRDGCSYRVEYAACDCGQRRAYAALIQVVARLKVAAACRIAEDKARDQARAAMAQKILEQF